jgi:hypothetical protein
MKKLPLYLPFLLIILYSCKKSNSGGGAPASPYYLSSAVAFEPTTRIVDSFYYDTLHRMTTFIQNDYDSFGGSPGFITFTVQFTYQGTHTWPSSYNYYSPSPGGFSGYHLLSYDADDRIIKDTDLNSFNYVMYFSYPNNNIAITTVYSLAIDDVEIDTLFVKNGNVNEEVYYTPVNNGPNLLLGGPQLTFGSIANPAFHPLISNSIGPLLFNLNFNGTGFFVDFISKNALQLADNLSNVPSYDSISYALSTDDIGRLSKMALISGHGYDSILFSYY